MTAELVFPLPLETKLWGLPGKELEVFEDSLGWIKPPPFLEKAVALTISFFFSGSLNTGVEEEAVVRDVIDAFENEVEIFDLRADEPDGKADAYDLVCEVGARYNDDIFFALDFTCENNVVGFDAFYRRE